MRRMRWDLDLPDELVGDQVTAAIVLNDGATLSPSHFEDFLASQPDLSPKAWPRYVRINDTLPQTATNKFLKRTLIQEASLRATAHRRIGSLGAVSSKLSVRADIPPGTTEREPRPPEVRLVPGASAYVEKEVVQQIHRDERTVGSPPVAV